MAAKQAIGGQTHQKRAYGRKTRRNLSSQSSGSDLTAMMHDAAAFAFDALAGVLVTDLDGIIIRVNEVFIRLSGYRRDELVGQAADILTADADFPQFFDGVGVAGGHRPARRGAVQLRRKGGGDYWVDLMAIPLQQFGYVFVGLDITSNVEQHLQLGQRERLLREIVDSFPGAIGVADEAARLTLSNDVHRSLAAQLCGDADAALPVGQLQLDDGKWIDVRCTAVGNGHVITTAFDITEERANLAAVEKMVEIDPLTGIGNRAYFLKWLDRINSHDGTHAVFYMDLDGFKPVNDRYGHAAGDRVLQAFAERLIGILRSSDIVARLGGDEFTAIQVGISSIDAAFALRDRIVANCLQPFDVGDSIVHVSVSVGLAIFSSGEESSAGILRRADASLYVAKMQSLKRIPLRSRETRTSHAEHLILEIST